MTLNLIAQLRAAASKATPGPWEAADGDAQLLTGYELPTPDGHLLKHTIEVGYPNGCDNSRYIALANPENILKLCAMAEEALELAIHTVEFCDEPETCKIYEHDKARAFLEKYQTNEERTK